MVTGPHTQIGVRTGTPLGFGRGRHHLLMGQLRLHQGVRPLLWSPMRVTRSHSASLIQYHPDTDGMPPC